MQYSGPGRELAKLAFLACSCAVCRVTVMKAWQAAFASTRPSIRSRKSRGERRPSQKSAARSATRGMGDAVAFTGGRLQDRANRPWASHQDRQPPRFFFLTEAAERPLSNPKNVRPIR